MSYEPIKVTHKGLTCSRCGRVFDLVSTTGPVTICDTCANYIFIICTLGLTPVTQTRREVTVWTSIYSR
jgi:rRNA maturation endonuclease Nob1